MNRQPFSTEREIIVANAIKEVVSELRMVEVADYIAYIRLERFASVADIVDSAAELYFAPGTLKLGHGGEARVSWDQAPQILLDLELRPEGATVYFTLALAASNASVQVNYVAFDDPSADPIANNLLLDQALENSRVRKTRPVVRAAQ